MLEFFFITAPFNTRINFNSQVLHAQECTHMNGIAFLPHPDLKKKKNQPTNPPDFQAKRANLLLFFFRPYFDHYRVSQKEWALTLEFSQGIKVN